MKNSFSSIRQQRNESSEQTEFDKYLNIPEIDQIEENDPLNDAKIFKQGYNEIVKYVPTN
ncbi:1169_t:CDS:2 [Racocetra fulgida]|uniref:1169_t:CDS:1 n=1 Tax=Racocetra fulgida TaxID=60492 RepID=A0A9N8ZJP6_9GLOM|nr:1169_t:CDS:2 [Racocetra fulgida]